MAYARWGAGSDVYVFAHYLGWVECCGCRENDFQSVSLHSRAEVVEHMAEHQGAGDVVPTRLLDPYTYDESNFKPMQRGLT